MTNPINFYGFCGIPLAASSHPHMSDSRPLFPLVLRLDGRACLVVGGGPVAARKAAALVECGAVVTVVAPETCAAVEALDVTIARRRYAPGEAASGRFRLVVTATGDPEVDRSVFLDAEGAGVLVNAADDPGSSSFHVPAVARRGAVTVAVSTEGTSPFLAGWVRSRVAEVLDEPVGDLARIVGDVRSAVRARGRSSEGLDWRGLVEERVWPRLSEGDEAGAEAGAAGWLAEVLSS